jgi:hypothetical protein
LQSDVCAWQFLSVDRDTDDSSILDGWVIEEQTFQFCGSNLVALDLDELL